VDVLLQQQLDHEGAVMAGRTTYVWLGFSSRRSSNSCLYGLRERQVGDTYSALIEASGSSNRERMATSGDAGSFIFDDGSTYEATLGLRLRCCCTRKSLDRQPGYL
jgi:hypothetical protein